jgi:hypothetical protein
MRRSFTYAEDVLKQQGHPYFFKDIMEYFLFEYCNGFPFFQPANAYSFADREFDREIY